MATRQRSGSRRSRQAVSGVLAGVLLLAGCSAAAPDTETPGEAVTHAGDAAATATEDGAPATSAPEDAAEGTEAGGPATSASEVPAGLEEFYDQQLAWVECEEFECAQLTVPVDYEEPDGATIALELLRVPAAGERQGSLVVNPGGPGASGVDYAKAAEMVISDRVREQLDVVGFDPRGVGGSAPIRCVEDSELDRILGADPSPDDDAERAQVDALLQDFAQSCAESAGDLLAHVSTVEAARDVDVLRSALGEERLDYLGKSYGTFLGVTYAELFPDRVGRMVLDGAIDPTLSDLERGLKQAEGFERATRAYVADCVGSGDCPLGADVESGLQRIRDFLAELDESPLPVEGDTVEELTEGWGMYGIIVAMYDQAGWPVLTMALQRAFDGDGSMLMFLANLYASRTADGTYEGNTMQAIYAVNCLDRPADDDVDPEEVQARLEEVSPTWGRLLSGGSACDHWPVEAQVTLEGYSAEGAPPIVVIGTTGDPATPHEWAVGLADVIDSGVLVSYDGDGHTAYGRSNACVDDAVDAYLLEGTVPQDGLSC